MHRILFALMLLTVPAGAAQPYATPPAVTGGPHSCGHLYPAEAKQQHHQGRTIVAFTITPEGTVADIVVKKSAGFAELDEAAKTCVAAWRYLPARDADGKPVAAPWKTSVVWELRKRSEAAQDIFDTAIRALLKDAYACLRKTKAFAAAPDDFVGDAEMKIALGFTGIMEATTAGSSGDAALDEKAAACLTQSPRMENLTMLMRMQHREGLTLHWHIAKPPPPPNEPPSAPAE